MHPAAQRSTCRPGETRRDASRDLAVFTNLQRQKANHVARSRGPREGAHPARKPREGAGKSRATRESKPLATSLVRTLARHGSARARAGPAVWSGGAGTRAPLRAHTLDGRPTPSARPVRRLDAHAGALPCSRPVEPCAEPAPRNSHHFAVNSARTGAPGTPLKAPCSGVGGCEAGLGRLQAQDRPAM